MNQKNFDFNLSGSEEYQDKLNLTIKPPNMYVAHNRQIVEFVGLQWEKIYPSDIDMVVEFKNNAWIFCETKNTLYRKPVMQRGQQLMIERLCDDLEKSGKPTIFFITTHSTPTDQKVLLAETEVVEYRLKSEWKTPNEKHALKECCDIFLQSHRGGV